MKTILAAVAASAGLAATAAPAHAAYVINLREVGSTLVATGAGSFDLTGLTFVGPGLGLPELEPALAVISVGADGHPPVDVYKGLLGPTSFGSGGQEHPQLVSGPPVELVGFNTILDVPRGYLSGAAVGTSTSVFAGSFASQGVTPGTYVWKWGQGDHADSLTLNIGGVPEPATWALMILGFGGAGSAMRRARRDMKSRAV